jgi:hypothetical protein
MRTLTSIRIGSINSSTIQASLASSLAGGVDFSSFESLTLLSLSRWATGSGHAPEVLLPPNLEMFEWVFDHESKQRPFFDDFDQEEEVFLRRLAQAAVEKKIRLRKLHVAIVFSPAGSWCFRKREPYANVDFVVPRFEWPWNRMDRLAKDIRPFGIDLTYNTPTTSWDRYVRSHKAWASFIRNYWKRQKMI